MTILNVISVVVFLALMIAAVFVYRYLRREVDEAEGVCSINERGEIGTSVEGDIVGEI